MKNILFIIAIVLIAVSCENLIIKDLELDETGFEKQLVVQAFLEGGHDSIKALISENLSVLENYENLVFINDANVALHKDGSEIAQLVQSSDGFYCHYFNDPISEIGEYELKVSNTKYADASARTQIPEQVQISDLSFKYDAGTDPLEMNQVSEVSFVIEDKPGENYYSIELLSNVSGYDTVIYENDTIIYENEVYIYPSTQLDPAVISSGYSDNVFISDASFDGKNYRVSIKYNIYAYGFEGNEEKLKEGLVVKVITHSLDSYNYESSLDRYLQSSDFGIFSEPVSVYTNIDNGLGVFAGSNSKIYRFN